MKLVPTDKIPAGKRADISLREKIKQIQKDLDDGIDTICNSKRSLKAIFYMAIQDDCLRKNPFDFQINEVINDDTEPKVPLTPAQEKELLKFIQDDTVYSKYYDEVVILLETGLRISEFCGLTPADLDFEKRFINVDHQLLRSTEDGYYSKRPRQTADFVKCQ